MYVFLYQGSGHDTIKPEWLRKMNKNAIGFFCANPCHESGPGCQRSRCEVVATDVRLSNQVNNLDWFPNIRTDVRRPLYGRDVHCSSL